MTKWAIISSCKANKKTYGEFMARFLFEQLRCLDYQLVNQ